MKIVATLLAAVFSSGIATLAFSQTNDTGRALVASDALKLSADTERSGGGETLAKKFIVPFAGVVRVRWKLKSGTVGGIVTATITSRIGSCSSSTSVMTYQQGVCNLRVVAGDLIEAKASANSATITVFIRDVRVFYNVVNNPGTGRTLMD